MAPSLRRRSRRPTPHWLKTVHVCPYVRFRFGQCVVVKPSRTVG